MPDEPGSEGLHRLLAASFCDPPLRHGSRFGRRHERGHWSGSETVCGAMAEVAFCRLLFLEGTAAAIDRTVSEHTVFRVRIETGRGVDLTGPAFASAHARLFSRTSYVASQPLGTAMRADGVEALLYRSARDAERACNVGVLTPRALPARRPEPSRLQTWHCTTTPQQVVFRRCDRLRAHEVVFAVKELRVRFTLPWPGG